MDFRVSKIPRRCGDIPELTPWTRIMSECWYTYMCVCGGGGGGGGVSSGDFDSLLCPPSCKLWYAKEKLRIYNLWSVSEQWS